MILIVSKEKLDPSTEDVIDWIHYYKKKFQRLNGDTLYNSENLFINMASTEESTVKIKGIDLNEKYNIAWYRRWSDKDYINNLSTLHFNSSQFQTITEVLSADEGACRKFIFSGLKVRKWLTSVDTAHCNKVIALKEARKNGLKIPHTIITGKKEDVEIFLKKHNKVINKDISLSYCIYENNETISSYTTELTPHQMDSLPAFFMPSMFQELINKEYEIRSFYLSKKFYSMAIFSQLDEQTQIDFRKYNFEKPNRTVPYKLPQEIERSLTSVMESLNFTTGSIDLIKSIDGSYIFLEINPVGQFGMTSYPCNYMLEKSIAEYLSKNDHD